MSEISRLKAKARDLHFRVQRELDSVDCGLSMLCYIRPEVGRLMSEFEATVARLREIDPEFPR